MRFSELTNLSLTDLSHLEFSKAGSSVFNKNHSNAQEANKSKIQYFPFQNILGIYLYSSHIFKSWSK